MHFLQIIILCLRQISSLALVYIVTARDILTVYSGGEKLKKFNLQQTFLMNFLVVYPKTYSHPANFHIIDLVFCIAGNRHEKCVIYPPKFLSCLFLTNCFLLQNQGANAPCPPNK